MLEVNETVCKDSLANIVLQVHDEIVVHCPERLVETALPKIEKAFKRIPEWCDDSLTLDLEIKISNHFTK
jgi:DNA polymerase I-like protein with 3'-5' exonuclease and polymerase domains